MNKVLLTGRIASEFELRKTSNNTSVMSFPIAVDTGKKDETGKRVAEFPYIQAWGQNADFLNQYAYKGVTIGVEGHLHIETNEYNGQKNTRVYVVADRVEILHKPEQKTEAVNNYTANDVNNFNQMGGNNYPW